MNPSTALATALVNALVGEGITDVVLCPGSRSAPLAYALHGAEAAGRLRLHVRIDERAGAFTALGLSQGSSASGGRGPAAVVTTSGTAVANLHPAVLEAHEAGVPLLMLTADRPPRLRGTWANQTTALQPAIFGNASRYTADLVAPAADGPALESWTQRVVEAVRAAQGSSSAGRPGPAHLDLGFDDPLAPDGVPTAATELMPARTPPAEETADAAGSEAAKVIEQGPRTVVLAGAGAGNGARILAETAGWPLLAEPSSGARCGPNAIGPYRLLLESRHLGGRIQRAVVFGRPTLSRSMTRLLDSPDVHLVVVQRHRGDPGPGRPVHRIAGPVAASSPVDDGWLEEWREAGRVAAAAVEEVLDGGGAAGSGAGLTGLLAAREVAAATGERELLVAAASNAVRDLDLAGRPWIRSPLVMANRGLSGIDGTLSTAVGASLALGGRGRALVGDLAFLHDLNGLLLGPDEREPDLQVVVLNDDGGGIFSLLEHGRPQYAAAFERIFGTAHGARLAALCAGMRVSHQAVSGVEDLRGVLAAPSPGLSVVEVAASRTELRSLHAAIRAEVASALRLVPSDAAT